MTFRCPDCGSPLEKKRKRGCRGKYRTIYECLNEACPVITVNIFYRSKGKFSVPERVEVKRDTAMTKDLRKAEEEYTRIIS